ncbi:MAG: hypothetical protein JSV49_05780, partial [Thermoplasmata archaeon]
MRSNESSREINAAIESDDKKISEGGRSSPGTRGVPDRIVEYLIITPASLQMAYQPLADWKTKKGVPTKIVTVESISANPKSWNQTNSKFNSTAAQIQKYLSVFNEENGYNLTWVLLGADHEVIPALWVYTEGSKDLTYTHDYSPTDYYYAGLFSNWNSDSDDYWGEPAKGGDPAEADYNPKAFVGRLPADTYQHVTNYVTALIDYEQSPPTDGWLSKALLADALFDHPNILDDYSTPSVDEGYGYWEDNGLEATMKVESHLEDDFSITHLYDYDQIEGENYDPAEDTLNVNTFVNTLMNGYGLVNVVSHSLLSGNATVSYEGDGATTAKPWKRFFDYNNASNLANGVKRPFMYFSDCDVLNFTEIDDSNFEKLFTNPDGGAIAVVGPTGSTYRGENDLAFNMGNWWIADKYWELFSKGYIRPGETLYRTKYAYYWYWFNDLKFSLDLPRFRVNMASYNLLGDPEVPIWPGDPKELSVEVTKLYFDSKFINITVKDSDTNSALQNALICIHGDDGTYLRYYTNASGKISVTSPFSAPATYSLTVTKDGYLPDIGTLRVYPEPSDLSIQSNDDVTFDFDTDPPLIDMAGNISVFISNLNPSSTESNFKVNFTDKYTYRSKSYTIYLGEIDVPVVPGNDKVEIHKVWAPSIPGEHTIHIVIDPDNNVDETNEDNNKFSITQDVNGPDLKIGSGDIKIYPSPMASVGDRVTLNVTVHNLDWGQVSEFVVTFYDGNPDAKGTFLGNVSYQGALNINEKINVELTTVPVETGGIHKYFVEVDPSNKIFESNEQNNIAFISYEINYPPSIIDLDPIIIDEDQAVTKRLDLLDSNLISDENNQTHQLKVQIENISKPEVGFSISSGRYVDLEPASNWSGEAVVNLSITDGIAKIYTELDVKVRPINDKPEIKQMTLKSTELKAGEEVELTIKFTDIDNDLLSVSITSISGLFSGQSYSWDVSVGVPLESGGMSWDGIEALTFKVKPEGAKPGMHTIKVTVNDGLIATSDSVDIELIKEAEKDDTQTLLGMDSDKAYLLIFLIIILVIVLLIGVLVGTKRRKTDEEPPSGELPELELPEEDEEVPGEEVPGEEVPG